MVNRRVVLTGAANSGKSTLIKELSNMDYNIIEETARQVLTEWEGHSPISIYVAQHRMYEKQLEAEKDLSKDCIVFLDRGLPDIIAYCKKLMGEIPSFINLDACRDRYEEVWFLESLGFSPDGTRIEKSPDEQEEIAKEIIRTYEDLGYKINFLPRFSDDVHESVPKRLEKLVY